MQKHLLISGHKGYIGSFFCKILRNRKVKFTKLNFKKNPKNLSKFTHLFHFDFKIKNNNNSFNINKIRIKKVLEICFKNKIKLIFPSTSTYKYDKLNKRISKKIFPINEYAKSKIYCENEILEYAKKKKLNFFIFRIFNVYGGDTNNRWVVASLIKRLKASKIITLKYSENIRDFIHIEDLCKLFCKCLSVKRSGVFEVGSGNTISIKKLALEIRKSLNIKSKIVCSKPYKSKLNYFSKSFANLTRKNFAWRPVIRLKQGLKNINN